MNPQSVRKNVVTPFLKWAGGKRWLTERHSNLLTREYNRYLEPFLGSGAVFFHIKPTNAILSDSNKQLIGTYRAIRDDYSKVLKHLTRHHRLHDKEYYYKIRQQRPRSEAGKAAQFIYLNRTCWNGLYRVNRHGVFNVPIGTKTNVVLPTDDFRTISQALEHVELKACDFEVTLTHADAGDFVFVDPPYTVKHNNNGFVKYNETLFSWEDQVRLRDCVHDAVARGANVMVTNAYHPSVIALYRGIGQTHKLQRSSVIAGDAASRGKLHEMVVTCFHT